MKKELGKSRLHLHLQTSMSTVPSSSTNYDGSSSSAPCSEESPQEDTVGADFEKLSMALHQNLAWQNSPPLAADMDSTCKAASPCFLRHMAKMEENLCQMIRHEVQQCVREALKDHLNSQTSTAKLHDQFSVLNNDGTVPDTQNSVRPKRASTGNEPLHLGITCDHCEQPVVGVRFKCGNCVDYDLCEECENLPGVHRTDHVFLKIRRPTCLATCRQRGEHRKSLLRHLYPQFGQILNQGPCNETFRCRKREKKVKRWLTHAENIFSGSSHPSSDRCTHRSSLLSGNRATVPLLGHTQSQSLHARHNPASQNKLQNVPVRCLTEVTAATPIIVQPGQEFEKEWKVRNDSQEQFSASYRLRFSWGSLVPQGQVEVGIPPLRPGEVGTVGPVHFRAPQQEGMYQSHWLLVSHPGGMPFPWPSLSCPVRVSSQKEALQDETKEADTVSAPFLTKASTVDASDTLKIVHITESETKSQHSPANNHNNNNNNTTDPEETDDTASILSISSCESDEDYVKVLAPTQLGFSTTTLLTKRQDVNQSSGAHLESQATSSSSIDLLTDMPQFDEETGQRQTRPSSREAASSQVQSTTAADASVHSSVSRSSVHSLNESNFMTTSEITTNSVGVQGEAPAREAPVRETPARESPARNPRPSGNCAPPIQTQPQRSDHTCQPEVVIPVLPEGLVTGALTAAASVYNTARAIISTLQPPMDHHNHSDSQSTEPSQGPPGPLSLLIEMGFHDRELNQRLLIEKEGCLEDVIAELIRLRPDHTLNID